MPSHATFFRLTILLAAIHFASVGCKFSQQSKAKDIGGNEDGTSEELYSFEEYVAECKNALGKMPPIDCSSGQSVNVYDLPHGENTSEPSARNTNGSSACANSSLVLGNDGCLIGAKLGTIKGVDSRDAFSQTEWTFLCRTNDQGLYSEVGVIGYNPKSGATCFFDTGATTGLTGSSFPPFDAPESEPRKSGFRFPSNTAFADIGQSEEKEDADEPENRRVWVSPSDLANKKGLQCVTCHSARPYIRNSYIMNNEFKHWIKSPSEVYSQNPSIPFHRSKPFGKEPARPYFVVAESKLNPLSARGSDLFTPKEIKGEGVSLCTGCHALGGHRYPTIADRLNGRGVALVKDDPETLKKLISSNVHWTIYRNEPGVLKSLPVPGSVKEFKESKLYKTLELLGNCSDKTTENPDCWTAPLKSR